MVKTSRVAGGATLEHVIKWNLYVVRGQSLRDGYAAFQGLAVKQPKSPAIAMAFVAGLANPDFLVEIDAIAVVPEP